MKRYRHLTKEQRYTISVCLRKKMSLSAIAKLIDVNKTTVSREIKKNSNMYRHYVAIEAQQFSEMRKAIPRRPRKLSKEDWQDIEQCLKRHWSLETIVGVRKREGKTCVSIEWLYHIIRRDKERGGTLYTYLPHHHKHRKRAVSSRIPIKDRVSIDERPAVVDSKSRFGDWEMDTIVGKDGKGVDADRGTATPHNVNTAALDHGDAPSLAVEYSFQAFAFGPKGYKTILHHIGGLILIAQKALGHALHGGLKDQIVGFELRYFL